ncbi:MAG: glycosyltransferase family 4 protein [Deltaproteobacteria bacterium]
MRILHLVSFPTMTGPADPALGLARAQRAAGIDVSIAIDRLREGNMLEKVRASEVPLVDGLTLSTKAVGRTLADLVKLGSVTKGFDVVHVHASNDHALAAARSAGRILVRSIHHPRSARRRGLQGWVYGRTDGFTVPAEAHRRLLLESYAPPEDRVIVLPGAVDERRFHPGVDGGSLRDRFSVPRDAIVVGMIARIKPGRGHDLLLEAFRRLAAPGVRLVFIGKGEGEATLDAAIAEHGLAEVTHRYGFRDADLPEAIRSCDVTVLLEEGNDAGCRAVLESMAVGVPVIGAAHPAIAEALAGADVGWTIPVRDVDALHAALVEAVGSEALRQAKGAAARAHVEASYTDARRAERMSAFYTRCLEGR